VFSLLPNVRPYFTFLFSIPQEQTRLKYSPVAKILSRIFSKPLKKTHMPIALSIIEGCAQSPRVNSYSYGVFVLVRISRSRSRHDHGLCARRLLDLFQQPATEVRYI
jgi:hypothetical protein